MNTVTSKIFEYVSGSSEGREYFALVVDQMAGRSPEETQLARDQPWLEGTQGGARLANVIAVSIQKGVWAYGYSSGKDLEQVDFAAIYRTTSANWDQDQADRSWPRLKEILFPAAS